MRRTSFCLILILMGLFANGWASAAEILVHDGALRVVTGDWAAWTTRGIKGTPHPANVDQASVTKLIKACDASGVAGAYAGAIARGLAEKGWAQLEQEPEKSDDHTKLRAYVLSAAPQVVVLHRYDLRDRLAAEATLHLPDGAVQSKSYDLPDVWDQSVYENTMSPENFVLHQEHYEKQFFESMLDLNRPGLEKVRDAYRNRDKTLAMYETAEYFRHKTTPGAFIVKPANPPAAQSDAAGDKVCDHIFTEEGQTLQLGPRINWGRHRKDEKTQEWLWDFNTHKHFVTLLRAYVRTSNEKYAKEFADEVMDFVIQQPAPPYSLTRVASWRNLEAGLRAANSWPQSFYGFLSSPSFTPQAIQLMLGGLWAHGHYILNHPAGLRRPSNWSVIDSTGLAAVSMYFPEFTDAKTWRKTGYARLAHQLQLQVYPDGAQYELATGYDLFCLGRFRQALGLAEQTGFELPADFSKRVESMYDYLMWLAKPSGIIPLLGDTHPSNIQGLLKEGATTFKRPDMLYVATHGAQGSAPEGISHNFPYAGFAVMRSDWSPQAQYLCFDHGPLGTGHQHEDKLSFVLSAYGHDFIIDPGPDLYNRDKWRRYAISSAAHSTVLIDGEGQSRIDQGVEMLAPDHPHPIWQSNKRFDYAYGEYTCGYGDQKIPVVHRRHVFFRKPGYWIIVDQIEGHGAHDIESLFHFAPDLKVKVSNGLTVRTQNADGPNLVIQPLISQEGLQASIIRGQEKPVVQGWYAALDNQRKPAPVASYRLHSALPVTQVYLLYPTATADSSVPTASVEQKEDGVIDVTVKRSGGSSDRIHIDTAKRAAELETD